ncbi:MAG: two-component system response regulator [Clostridiales bacterium]|nr:two-component system response regulator [Clostridiales bacterium]
MKKILIAEDEKNMRWILRKNLEEDGFEVIEAADGEEAFNLYVDLEPDMAIVDYKMPKIDGMEVLRRIKKINDQIPIIMVTAHGSTDAAVEAMKLGALDYISKPFDIHELKMTIKKVLKIDQLSKEVEFLKTQIFEGMDKKIIGNSRGMVEVFEIIQKVADTSATVLITGESGTGKELVAGAIHNFSTRKERPYIKVNCGAIPENLLESELFGYEKGAFTGAQNRKVGRFDRAQGGTLFLDEIGELSLSLQVKILRVLQEREFERVGGTEVIKADVRIIAATNRDLGKMVEEGNFREDLLYRLKVIPIRIPPLRERKEDINSLVDYFIEKYSREMNKGTIRIDEDVLEILKSYDYPGNIRELENIIERLVILSADGQITTTILPKEVIKGAYSNRKEPFILPEEGVSLEEVEESFVRQALERSKGNQTQAAKLLGISRHALIYRMDKFKLQ